MFITTMLMVAVVGPGFGEGSLATEREVTFTAEQMQEAINQAIEFTLVVLVGIIVVVLLIDSVPTLVRFYRSRKHYPVRTIATRKRVETRSGRIGEVECCNCGVETDQGERRTWSKDRVVFGFIVEQLEGGENEYCEPCATDPIEAALRADRARRGEPLGISPEPSPPEPGEWEAAYQEAYGDA